MTEQKAPIQCLEAESVSPLQGQRPDSAFRLLQHFVDTVEAFCPRCGYSLRHLSSPSCPECGEGLRLMVAREERRLGAWLTLLVMLCLAAGPGLFLVAGTFARGRVLVSDAPGTLVFSYWYLMAAVPLMVIAAGVGRWFTRWPWGWQWGLALLAAGINVLMACGLVWGVHR